MPPLEIRMQHPLTEQWIKFGEVKPEDRPGSISDNTSQGRQIYLFSCKDDDSGSTIYRSKLGIDVDLSDTVRLVNNLTGFETVKDLSKGESFEIIVKTDRSKESRNIKFTHV
ncbi:MAG: hypothetical protein Q8P26_03500 [Candidatus Levybacteria bacterium]|nr:hypothetical protein [Candidatus Levybacteria bacterium]